MRKIHPLLYKKTSFKIRPTHLDPYDAEARAGEFYRIAALKTAQIHYPDIRGITVGKRKPQRG
jgi:hypothetical protein